MRIKVLFSFVCWGLASVLLADAPKSYLSFRQDASQSDSFLQHVAEAFEQAKWMYVATFDGTAARVRPFGYTAIIDNRLILATSTKKEVYAQLKRCPEIEVCATQSDGKSFVRYKGKAVESESAELRAFFTERFPFFQKKYTENLRLFQLEPEMAGIFPEGRTGTKPETKIFKK